MPFRCQLNNNKQSAVVFSAQNCGVSECSFFRFFLLLFACVGSLNAFLFHQHAYAFVCGFSQSFFADDATHSDKWPFPCQHLTHFGEVFHITTHTKMRNEKEKSCSRCIGISLFALADYRADCHNHSQMCVLTVQLSRARCKTVA